MASVVDAPASLADVRRCARICPPNGTRLGISLSGGGIRSTAFSLGVFQQLQDAGIFSRARFLSGVSGGGYLAAGLAISRARPATDHQGNRVSVETGQTTSRAPWSRRSAEEQHLRRSLSYLAPGTTGRVWLVANVLYGLVFNLLPLVLGAFLLGRLYGLVLAGLYPGLASSDPEWIIPISLTLALGLTTFLVAVCAVWVRRFRHEHKKPTTNTDAPDSSGRCGRTRHRRRDFDAEQVVSLSLCLCGSFILLGVVLPFVIHLLAVTASPRVSRFLGAAGTSWVVQRLIAGFGAIMLALMLGGVAVALFRRRRARRISSCLAVIAGAAILVVPFIMAAETGAVRARVGARDGAAMAVTLLILVLFAVLAHNRRYSMHPFYRERLQHAFATERVVSKDGSIKVREILGDDEILLSEVAADNARVGADGAHFPELIMCAAVATRGGEGPYRTFASHFTFEGECCGNADLGLQFATTDLEHHGWMGGGKLTLPSMMAISGAALSPMMGRFTVPAFRLLLAMLNIRLGVWLDTQTVQQGNGDGSLRAPECSPTEARGWRKVVDGFYEPGALYVLKEALGLAHVERRQRKNGETPTPPCHYIYVSDGGHYENLGCVELMRRHCTDIIVVDAGGDPSLADIGRAMAIARAELGVDVRLDPTPLAQQGEQKLAHSPVVVGTYRYPRDGGNEPRDEGDIYLARCVLWPDAPADLHLFAEHDTPFPNHPTVNQFMPGDRFDAYHALGLAVGERLIELLRLPPPSQDEKRSPPHG